MIARSHSVCYHLSEYPRKFHQAVGLSYVGSPCWWQNSDQNDLWKELLSIVECRWLRCIICCSTSLLDVSVVIWSVVHEDGSNMSIRVREEGCFPRRSFIFLYIFLDSSDLIIAWMAFSSEHCSFEAKNTACSSRNFLPMFTLLFLHARHLFLAHIRCSLINS